MSTQPKTPAIPGTGQRYKRIPGYEHYANKFLDDAFDSWLDHRKAIVQPSSMKAYKQIMSDALEHFHGLTWEEMTQEHANALVTKWITNGLNGNTIHGKVKYLRLVIKFALETNMTNRWPFSFRLLPKAIRPIVEKVPFTWKQHLKLVAELSRQDAGYYPFWSDVCAIAWHTGLRCSDVALMKRSLVKLDSGVIINRSQKKMTRREELEIPIVPELMPIMVRLYNTTDEHGTDYMHYTVAWHYLNERDEFPQQIRKACDAVGLPRHSFHSYRHSFVTRLLDANVNPIIISSMTGQTLREIQTYAHVQNSTKRAALESARNCLSGTVKEVEVEIE